MKRIKRLVPAGLVGCCMIFSTPVSAGTPVERDHKIADKIATHLPSRESGEIPTDNGTWSWQSDRDKQVCESLKNDLFVTLLCAYWTGHAE